MAITFTPTPSAGQTFTSGQKTWTWNGTIWKATPTILATSLSSFNAAMPSGSIIQTVVSYYSTNADLTTALTTNDSVPQDSQGTLVFSQPIIVMNSSSKVLLNVIGFGGCGVQFNIALFRSGNTNALNVVSTQCYGSNVGGAFALAYLDSPAALSATYTVRVGCTSGYYPRLNGSASARQFGGAAATTFTLQEIKG